MTVYEVTLPSRTYSANNGKTYSRNPVVSTHLWWCARGLVGGFASPGHSQSKILGGPIDMAAPTTFASRSERALAASILRDDFGDTAEKVADLLLRSEGLRLAEIAQRLRADQSAAATPLPSLHKVCLRGELVSYREMANV